MNTILNKNENETRTNLINAIKKIVIRSGVWGSGLGGFNSLAFGLKKSNVIIDVQGYDDWHNGKGRLYHVVVIGAEEGDTILDCLRFDTIKDDDVEAYASTYVEELPTETLANILAELTIAEGCKELEDNDYNRMINADIIMWHEYATALGRDKDKEILFNLYSGKYDDMIKAIYHNWEGCK